MLLTCIVLFLLGYAILFIISSKFSVLEFLGASLPIGFGINTILMFLYNLIGIRFSLSLLLITSFILAIALLITALSYRKASFKLLIPNFSDIKLAQFNIPWLVLAGFTLYMLYGISYKCMFWPNFNLDSVNGYDYMAKALAFEGLINNSIFSPENSSYNIRVTYPLMASGSYSLAYMNGLEMINVVSILFYISGAILYYALLKNFTNHLGAMFFTFLFVMTPELLANAAMPVTNVIHTLFSSSAIIALYLWYKKNECRYFIFGMLFMIFNVWSRTDGIVFTVGGGLLVLLKDIQTRKFLNTLIYSIVTPSLFIAWQIYLKVGIGVSISSDAIMTTISWNPEKLDKMLPMMWDVIYSSQYFGISVYLFTFILILQVSHWILKRVNYVKTESDIVAQWPFLASILVSLFLYIFLYYQMPFETPKFTYPMKEMLYASFKRGIFNFIPMILCYIASADLIVKLSNKSLSH